MNFTNLIMFSLVILITLFSIIRPKAALFSFVFALMAFNDYLGGHPSSILNIGHNLFYAADFFLILLVAGLIRNILRRDLDSRVDKMLLIIMIVNVAMGIVAILVGIDNGHNSSVIIGDFRRYCYYPFAIFIPAMYLKSYNDIRMLERLVFGAATVICTFAAYRIITGSSYWPEQNAAEYGYFRAMSFHDYHILILAFCISIGKVVDVKGQPGLLPNVFLSVLPIFVIASNYRIAGLLMGVCSLLVLLILRRSRMNLMPKMKQASLAIILIVAVIFAGTMTENKTYLDVKKKFVERVVYFNWQEQETYREEMWKTIIKQWSVSPFFGVGFGRTFSYERRTPEGQWYWAEAEDFHNTYLGLLLKKSIIGLTIFLSIYLVIVTICVRALRICPDQMPLLAGGIVFTIALLIESALQPMLSIPNSIVASYLIIGSVTSLFLIATSAVRYNPGFQTRSERDPKNGDKVRYQTNTP